MKTVRVTRDDLATRYETVGSELYGAAVIRPEMGMFVAEAEVKTVLMIFVDNALDESLNSIDSDYLLVGKKYEVKDFSWAEYMVTAEDGMQRAYLKRRFIEPGLRAQVALANLRRRRPCPKTSGS